MSHTHNATPKGLRIFSKFLAAAYGIALLACGITNLAVTGSLSWFWLVLAALTLASTLTILPAWLRRFRGTVTVLSSWLSLNLLLLACALWTSGAWFPVASASIFLALSLAGLPFMLHVLPFTKAWKHKGLVWMGVNSLLVFGLLWIVALFAGITGIYASFIFPVAAFSLLLPWAIFLTARYLPASALVRTGLSFLLSGGFTWVFGMVFPALNPPGSGHALASDISALSLAFTGLALLVIQAFKRASRT